MAIEVFNRYENKYMVGEDVCTQIQTRLDGEMTLDSHHGNDTAYQICNIYYDTDDDQLIKASLSGPRYKEKLRLRTYGTPPLNSKIDSGAFLEIKKKVRGLVNKRRSAMPLQEAYTFIKSGIPPDITPGMNAQVIREIAYILTLRPLKPKVYIAYERRAYFGSGNSDLRVSFDTNIVTRRDDLRLEFGVYGERLLPDGIWLMEIKTAQSIPLWLSGMLSEYKIYPQGFSKYGEEYKRNLNDRDKQRTHVFVPKTYSHALYIPNLSAVSA